MSKKWDNYKQIKLTPNTYKAVKEICEKNSLRPSLAKMADALIWCGIEMYHRNGRVKP
jgi:hypothetical protein